MNSKFLELIQISVTEKKDFDFIERIIKVLFHAIANTESLDECELYFENLDDIQIVLGKCIYHSDIEISFFIDQFLKDFDNLGDNDWKTYLYNKIKSDYQN